MKIFQAYNEMLNNFDIDRDIIGCLSRYVNNEKNRKLFSYPIY